MRIERINDMERYIIENGSVTSDKLCEVFRISKNTLLRDLNILAEKGTVKKVYGGVTALQQPFSVKELLPFNDRTTTNIDLKSQAGGSSRTARGYHFCRYRHLYPEYHQLYSTDTGPDRHYKQCPVHVPGSQLPQHKCDCASGNFKP